VQCSDRLYPCFLEKVSRQSAEYFLIIEKINESITLDGTFIQSDFCDMEHSLHVIGQGF
jgi:hypothetical protein